MSNIALWNIQAGSNTNAPPDGAPENMLRSAVNNTMREMMAATRRWYGDSQSSQLTTGTGAAYLLDSVGKINGAGYSLYTDLPILTFRAHVTNTGPVTLNVDSLGTKSFFKAPGSTPFGAGDIVAGQVMVVAYNSVLGAFELIGPRPKSDSFTSNTVMIFKMATPPVGWIKSSGDDDSSIRIIGGAAGVPLTSGGTTGLSVVFAPRTIVAANLPNIDFMGITLTGDTTNNTATITNLSANPATAGWAVGNLLRGAGIPNGTTIASMAANSVVMSAQATATNAGIAIQAAVPTATLIATVPTSINNGTLVLRNLKETNFVSGSFGNQGGLADAFKGLAGSTNAPDQNTISLNSGLVNFSGCHLYLNGNVAQVPMDFSAKYVDVIVAVKS